MLWNKGFEEARTDYRLKSWPCLGKHSPTPKHLNQYCVTVKSVWSAAELLAEGGVHRKNTGRRLFVRTCWQRSSADFKSPRWNRRTVFEEVLKIVKAEVKLGRSPTQELDAEFTPAPAPGWKTFPTKKHAGAAPTTPKKATHHLFLFDGKSREVGQCVRKIEGSRSLRLTNVR